MESITLSRALTKSIVEAGVGAVFCVPGDFNLLILDDIVTNSSLEYVGCCNELNAAYAADGYARKTGIGVVVTTYMVGGLSAINAIAGSFSDDIPVLLISGSPNINDESESHIIHHTNGELDFSQQARCFGAIVNDVFRVRSLSGALHVINDAIRVCLDKHKPVYLEIPCNFHVEKIVYPGPMDFTMTCPHTDKASLSSAVLHIVEKLNSSSRPVLICGSQTRSSKAKTELERLADSLGMAVATTPDAKGVFPEDHPLYIGIYWGATSTSKCLNIIESSDCYLTVGTVFSDYSTAGWSTVLDANKLIQIHPDYVDICGAMHSHVPMKALLEYLIPVVPRKEASIQAYRRIQEPHVRRSIAPRSSMDLVYHLQTLVDENTDVFVDIGDSWFIGERLQLPRGADFHIQMQYGSSGWSLGAGLGAAIASRSRDRQTLIIIGDGAFQMVFQELSTILQHNLNVKLILINNGGYTIDVEIRDGPYNKIKCWNYLKLVDIFRASESAFPVLTYKVCNNPELESAVREIQAVDHFAMVECVMDIYDCTPELLEWGSRIFAANSRQP